MNNNESGFSRDIDFVLPFAPFERRRPTEVENIAELIWQNGQVVTQSQKNRDSSRKALTPEGTLSAAKFHQHNLYEQDDEMNMMLQSPWNQYSNFDGNEGFCNEFLFNQGFSPGDVTTASVSSIQNVESLQMIPPSNCFTDPAQAAAVCSTFPCHQEAVRLSPSIARESTVVDSCATPSIQALAAGGSATFVAADNSITTPNPEEPTWEFSPTSSTGGSSAGAQLPRVSSPFPNHNTVDKPSPDPGPPRTRKAEDAHAEKKPARGSKRTRAAEVHNLSERRRRDRINEKMQELQELIPRCNKLDKASMLDEAIEYLKSLQLQVQMMAMGCGMLPMVFPGMQQFLPAMGMRSPFIPFSNVIPAPTSTTVNPTSSSPLPAFHYPPMAAQESILTNPSLLNPNLVRFPAFADSFQPYLSPQQAHFQNHANKGNKGSSSRAAEGHDKKQRGL